MKYKYLLVSDMDYTLVMPGCDVSEANRKAIEMLRENGCAFSLATGRTSFLVGKYTDDLGIDIPCLTSNGAALFDPVSFKDVYSNNIPEVKVRALLRLLEETNSDFCLYSSDGVYFGGPATRMDFFDEYNKGLPPEKQAVTYRCPRDFYRKDIPSANKFLIINPHEEIVNFLKLDPELECVFSAKGFFDVMKKGSTKGSALRSLAEYLNIPMENTFAAGDSENDLSMIAEAAHGIAMKNSEASVLEASEYITDSCENDGFASAVRNFVIPILRQS